MGRCCFNSLPYSRYNYSENLLVGKRHRRPKSIWYCYLIFFITCLKPSSIPHYWKLESTSRIWNVKPLKTFDMEKIHRGALSFFFGRSTCRDDRKFEGSITGEKRCLRGVQISMKASSKLIYSRRLRNSLEMSKIFFWIFSYFGYNGQQNVFRKLFEE